MKKSNFVIIMMYKYDTTKSYSTIINSSDHKYMYNIYK